MTFKIELNYAKEYRTLLNELPELKETIKKEYHNHTDILKIARSVILKEIDGSILISKKDLSKIYDRKVEVSNREIELIRKICAQRGQIDSERGVKRKEQEEIDNVPVKSHKALPEGSVGIVRKRIKRKAEDNDNEDFSIAAKRPKQDEPVIKRLIEEEIGDFFKEDSKVPNTIMKLAAEYIERTPTVVADLTYEKRLPNYLKDITHLDLRKENLTLATFLSILSECKNLKSLKLPEYVDDFYIEAVANNLPNLKHLDIRYCKKVTDVSLRHIADRMKFIEKLTISGCERVTNEGVDLIIQNLEQLQEFVLLGCEQLSDKAFENIAKRGDTLQSLELSHTKISDETLNFIIQNINKLKKLSFNGCDISDNGLLNIGKFSESLEVIGMRGRKITGSFLAVIDQNFTVMKNLLLPYNYEFDPNNLVHCRYKFPALKYLDLSHNQNLTSSHILDVVKGATDIETINLYNCKNVDDHCMEHIANNCQNLKDLKVNYSKVTSSGIGSIARGCPKLTNLSAGSCYAIDDDGLKSLADNCHELSYLDLYKCSRVTDKGLEYISIGCPDLSYLALSQCAEITDNGILQLSQRIKNLRYLFIQIAPRITSSSIDHISKWSNSLQSLKLSECSIDGTAFVNIESIFTDLKYLELQHSNISDHSIEKIVQLSPALEELNLNYNKRITDKGISLLKNLQNLSDLSIKAYQLTNLSVDHIIEIPKIKKITVAGHTGITHVGIVKLRKAGISVC